MQGKLLRRSIEYEEFHITRGQQYFSFLNCIAEKYTDHDLFIEIIRIVKKLYKPKFEELIEDPLGDSYFVIFHVGTNALSIEWHYAMGLMMIAENKESDQKLTEVAKHVYEQLVEKGIVNTP